MYKYLSHIDNGLIVRSRRLGLNINETSGFAGCTLSGVISIYSKWSKKTTVERKDHPWFIEAFGEHVIHR